MSQNSRIINGPLPYSPQRVHTLTHINAHMFAEAFKLRGLQTPLAMLLRPIAQAVAHKVVMFHDLAGYSLGEASRWAVDQFCDSLTTLNSEAIPTTGPLIVTCNHPGVMDAMGVFASLPRDDVRVIARTRNLLEALPNISQYVIYVSEDSTQHMGTLRQAIAHLKAGGCIVTFPAGEIEPDPQLHSTAAQAALSQWSRSVGLLARHVPQAVVVPAAIGGVIAQDARQTWIARAYRTPVARDWVAATLQFMFERYRHITPTLGYGNAISAQNDVDAMMSQIREQTSHLLCRVGNVKQTGKSASAFL